MTGNSCQWELGNSDAGPLTARPAPAGPVRAHGHSRCPRSLLLGRDRQDARERVPEPLDQWQGQIAIAAEAVLALWEQRGHAGMQCAEVVQAPGKGPANG
jgi:hypothetical protein